MHMHLYLSSKDSPSGYRRIESLIQYFSCSNL
jgi:hypothetical protein